MDDSPPSLESDQPTAPSVPLMTRLTNIFVAPGEVFDAVKLAPSDNSNWIVPAVLMAFVGVIFALVVFSQPAIVQRIHDAQEQALQKQADDAMAFIDKYMGAGMLKAFGILGAIFGSALYLFIVALAFWLVARFAFHADFSFMRATEAVGLTMMISVLATVVQLLLTVIYGNPAVTPGPALFISGFDPNNRVHMLLSTLNVMSFWYVAVLSIGLARLAQTTFLKAAVWMYCLWALVKFGPFAIVLLLPRRG